MQIIASPPTADVIRTMATRDHRLANPVPQKSPNIETVDGRWERSDSKNPVQLIVLPPGNPQADGFVVVYLPGLKLMYFTSFIYPVPKDNFPVVESVPLSLWFVRWLDGSGLEVERLYNVHGDGLVESWQPDELRALLGRGEPVAGD